MKRAGWIGLTAAAVVVACAAAVVVPYAVGEERPVPSTCPARWGSEQIGGWVPAAADLDEVEDTLVPGEPVSALICVYPGQNAGTGGEPLAGSRTLTDQAAAMARDLAHLPVARHLPGRACTLRGGLPTNYLLRFAYPDGRALWVGSAEEPNSCVTTTNGTAETPAYIGPGLAAAYREGVWRLPQRADPCAGVPGRRGQGESLVPGEPVEVLVCAHGRNGDPRPAPSRAAGRP
ncbi:hypothetical protein E1286_14815 [Nonomuraea terrae]|uniref:Uncharacterized protein n=1 Tax=Nonomuraea terrae TaxID=2530383 RepID=A0A4R4YVK3_9ACTN|nr:hypothetical protein [Nonomuraea terrae]TDD48880.1 hypothetical protein E1286_14815 [Nonomuraea terrae]